MTDRNKDARTPTEQREDALDEALEESFPASDPPAPVQPHRHPRPDGKPGKSNPG
jgi:hypothetical protein